MNSESFTLDNGYTFHAVVQDLGATWARATDPITAIRNAARAHTSNFGIGLPVVCMYGKADELQSDEWGSFRWKIENEPVPIGLFNVTKTQIKPMPKGLHNDRHASCEEWITDTLGSINFHHDRVTEMRLAAND